MLAYHEAHKIVLLFTFPDLYRLSGDEANEAEGCRLHTSFSQSLLTDHFQSSQHTEHGLIQVNLHTVIIQVFRQTGLCIWRYHPMVEPFSVNLRVFTVKCLKKDLFSFYRANNLIWMIYSSRLWLPVSL